MCVCVCVCVCVWLSHVHSPWTVAHQTPLSMEFSRQEYWGGLPFPSPGDLPDPGIKPGFPVLQADSCGLYHITLTIWYQSHAGICMYKEVKASKKIRVSWIVRRVFLYERTKGDLCSLCLYVPNVLISKYYFDRVMLFTLVPPKNNY